MSINVYWACCENQWMLARPPDPVTNLFYEKKLYDKNNPNNQINFCPAFQKNLTNVFTMRSIYDYELSIDDTGSIHSSYYNQEFFDNHVVIRSPEHRLFSFIQSYVFFTDRSSLEATICEFPYLEDNNITKRCIPLSGKFDIGRWFRPSEFAFYLKKDYDSFIIKRDEVFGYIRFHTNEKINFIQFRYNSKLEELKNDGFSINFFRYMKTMENYYKSFKNKKLILKEIKENII
jgi:hypothetical protein